MLFQKTNVEYSKEKRESALLTYAALQYMHCP